LEIVALFFFILKPFKTEVNLALTLHQNQSSSQAIIT
jgi:hypothetical protein